MKLKNKQTGEIVDLDIAILKAQFGGISVIPKPHLIQGEEYVYNSLTGLYEEWEDYEEEQVNYIIDPIESSYISCDDYYEREELERAEELGIRFDSEEEAELAAEKLKAWKRLKDKGFKICGWNMAMRELDVEVPEKFFDKQGSITMEISDETKSDLDRLFSRGEE